MHVESVTWIAERKDVMYGFFFLLSSIFYLKYHISKKKNALIICFIFFVCSCLSKAMGVVLPVVFILIDWFLEKATTKELLRNTLSKIPFFLVSIAIGIIAFQIQREGAIASAETFTFFQRLTFGCYGLIMYIYKFFLPINLSTFYPYPFTDDYGNIPAIYYLSPAIVLFIAIVIFFILKKKENIGKILAFGFAFYFVTIALVLQFISVGAVIMADRYSYLSYIGLFFIVGYFFEYTGKYFSSFVSKLFAGIIIISIGIFSYLTHERTKIWTNAETLWTDVMNQFPFVEISYENRGIFYKDHNQLDKMLIDYKFVTEKLHSKNEKIWSNLGNLYGLLKQFDKSLVAYSRAIELNPKNAGTYLNRAITYSMMGQYAKAIPDYDKAIVLIPNESLTYKNRAYTLLQLGKCEQSISDYDKAIQLNEYDTLSFLNRGIAKFNAKLYNVALKDFQKYISMNPNNPQAYFNASVAAKNMELYNESLQYAERAQSLGQKIDPKYIEEIKTKKISQ
ncbi:MAG: tetratricopeptide repeat protein [Bacteroidota bacterium]